MKLSKKAALARLTEARKQQNTLLKEVKALREYLMSLGVNPDLRKDYSPRNWKIYQEWKKGKTYKEVATMFKLSGTTISNICKRLHRKQSGTK